MRKLLFLALFQLLTGMAVTFGQGLDTVLQQFNKINGLDKPLAAKSYTITGRIMQFGTEMPFTIVITASGKSYLEVPQQDAVLKRGFDGRKGWISNPWINQGKVQDIEGVDLKSLKNQADIKGPLYDWKKKGYQTTLEGKETLDGVEVFVIKQVDADGETYFHYIDTVNYHLVMSRFRSLQDGWPIESLTYYSDYRTIDGMLMPFITESKVQGQIRYRMEFDEVLKDKPFDPAVFEKPASQP